MTTPRDDTSPWKGEVDREAAGRGSSSRFSRSNEMTRRARHLRSNQTDAERRLWQSLRRNQLNNLGFRRQHPVGRYTLDFYCSSLKLAIELDGGQHAERRQEFLDQKRTLWLASKGIRVVRFWNNDVLNNIVGVRGEIARVAAEISKSQLTPSPTLPLSGGGSREVIR